MGSREPESFVETRCFFGIHRHFLGKTRVVYVSKDKELPDYLKPFAKKDKEGLQ